MTKFVEFQLKGLPDDIALVAAQLRRMLTITRESNDEPEPDSDQVIRHVQVQLPEAGEPLLSDDAMLRRELDDTIRERDHQTPGTMQYEYLQGVIDGLSLALSGAPTRSRPYQAPHNIDDTWRIEPRAGRGDRPPALVIIGQVPLKELRSLADEIARVASRLAQQEADLKDRRN